MIFAKLKGRLREKGYSQNSLAKEIGITVQALNAKLNGRSSFTIPEVINISKILDIEEPTEFFFNNTSQKCNETKLNKKQEENNYGKNIKS